MADFNSLAVLTTVVTVGSAEVARIKQKKGPTMKPVIGGFILGLFLFGLGVVNVRIATLFCYLVIVGALLINGASLFATVK